MALKALCRLGSWNQSEGEKSEMGGVRLYPSCPICLITASIIALRSARLAAQHGCLDCLSNEAVEAFNSTSLV